MQYKQEMQQQQRERERQRNMLQQQEQQRKYNQNNSNKNLFNQLNDESLLQEQEQQHGQQKEPQQQHLVNDENNKSGTPVAAASSTTIFIGAPDGGDNQDEVDSKRNRMNKRYEREIGRSSNNSRLDVTRIRKTMNPDDEYDVETETENKGNDSSSTTIATKKKKVQKFVRPNPNIDIRIQMGSDMKTIIIQTKDKEDDATSAAGGGATSTATTNSSNAANQWKDLLPSGIDGGGGRSGSSSSNRAHSRYRYNLQTVYAQIDPLMSLSSLLSSMSSQSSSEMNNNPNNNNNNYNTIDGPSNAIHFNDLNGVNHQQQHTNVQTTKMDVKSHEERIRYYLPIQPSVPYLGVLVDAGRHYYHMDWLLRLLDYLTLMRYNLVHFRLTDDQAFNVQLESYPQLAFPSVVLPPPPPPQPPRILKGPAAAGDTSRNSTSTNYTPGRKHHHHQQPKQQRDESQQHKVYTPNELRYFVQQAKLRNITVIPEINVPGHAGAWGGIPDLIMKCPNFICRTGYGVPMNVSHANISTILFEVLHEIVTIFDSPPFLHLGGDEVEMGYECFLEHEENAKGAAIRDGAVPTDNNPTIQRYRYYSQFENFEKDVLPGIIHKLGYSENQIIRWERKDERRIRRSKPRFGRITQYWQSIPNVDAVSATIESNQDNHGTMYAMASTGLYFDMQEDVDGWEYYKRTQDLLRPWLMNSTKSTTGNYKNPGAEFLGIIAGTFELGSDMWLDRNVIGRLLAVAMAASDDILPEKVEVRVEYSEIRPSPAEAANVSDPEVAHYVRFKESYLDHCVAHLNINPRFCDLVGQPTLRKWTYAKKWRGVWKEWKEGLCHRLTEEVQQKRIQTKWFASDDTFMIKANERYWDSFGRHTSTTQETLFDTKQQHERRDGSGDGINHDLMKLFKQHSIPHTGIIMDAISGVVNANRAKEIIQSSLLSSFGFNTIQLRLVNDDAFAMSLNSFPNLRNTPLSLKPALSENDLQVIIDAASQVGMEIFPEISTTTNVGGWYKAGFLVDCPDILCQGVPAESSTGPAPSQPPLLGVMSHNITNYSLLPVLLTVIKDLKRIFTTSNYIHLGSDERQLGLMCSQRRLSGVGFELSDYGRFEKKLSKLLEMEGIALDGIVRWNNNENVEYSDRTGPITQFYDNVTSVPSREQDKKIFTVVNLSNRGPWTIFKTTRAHARLSPTAIMAELKHLDEIRWAKTGTTQRLLAFAMGLANSWTNDMDREEFETKFTELCGTLKEDVTQCREFVQHDSMPDMNPITAQKHFLDSKCEHRTYPYRIRVARE